MRNAQVNINLAQLRLNLRQLKSLTTAQNFFCPMVKANAYGHGSKEIARCLAQEGVKSIGVALLEEALELRNDPALRSIQILVFASLAEKDFDLYLHQNLSPVVGRLQDLVALAKFRKEFSIHLKLNTGMSRLGLSIEELDQAKKILKDAPFLNLDYLCTHLLNGEDAGNPKGHTQDQLKLFEEARSFLSVPLSKQHALNSSGLLSLWSHSHPSISDLGVRPGIALYGLSPEIEHFDENSRVKMNSVSLQPIMSLETEISHSRRLRAGESVSYAARWTAKRDSVIGVIPVGYGDGVPRSLSNRGEVLFGGKRVPIVGTVTMDYTMLDLTDCASSDLLGRPVQVFGGAGPSAKEVGAWAGTIDYEVVTRMTSRLPRVYRDT